MSDDINYLKDIAGKSFRNIIHEGQQTANQMAQSPIGQIVQGQNPLPALKQELTQGTIGGKPYNPQMQYAGEAGGGDFANPKVGLSDITLADKALSKFGEINPEELGNFKGYIHPNGKYIKSGGYNGLGDHSEVASLMGMKQGGVVEDSNIVHEFQKRANAVRIGRNADETFIHSDMPLNPNQLQAVKKSLLPDGGTIEWEGKNNDWHTIEYADEQDGLKKFSLFLKEKGLAGH